MRTSGLIVSVAVTFVLPKVAPIVEVVAVVTCAAAMEKVAEVEPAAIVTFAGSVALVLLELSEITKPPVGAGLLRVTVPVDVDPPVMLLGANVIEVSAGAAIARVAVAVVPRRVPEIVALVDVVTAMVATVKVAELVPAATVTVDGTVALELFELRVMTAPPVGAGPFKVTVAVEEVPPFTEVGASVSELRDAAAMLRVALAEVPARLAVSVAVVAVATAEVVTLKVAVVAPAATFTVAGTPALVELEVRATAIPPLGAGLPRVMLPVAGDPPISDVGATLSAVTVGATTVKVVLAVTPCKDPEIVAVVVLETPTVLTINVAEVAPAGTVTFAGTVALVELELRTTMVPLVGAGPLSVTVPVDVPPPVTSAGDNLRELSAAAVMFNVALADELPRVAVSDEEVDVETAVVVTVNVAVVDPPATVTVDGTVALPELDERVMTDPPEGAGPLRVTVPVDGEPPMTEVGAKVSDANFAAVMLNVAFADELPSVAVNVAEEVVPTAEVVIVKVTDVEPPATVTVAGKPALDVLEVRATAIPPMGAALLMVTVPVADVPPKTEVGATESEVTVGAPIVKTALAVTP